MIQYTDEQRQILQHDPNKHACILAGPGTGKSSMIIAYVEQVHSQYPEKKIKMLTFTRAANGELMEKISSSDHIEVISSTFHSFAISILLNNHGVSSLPEPIRIADVWEWNQLIKSDLAARLSSGTKVVEKLKNEMSAYWESLSPEEDPAMPIEIRGRFMGMWEEHRRVFGYSLLSEFPFRLKIALESNTDLDVENIQLLAVDEYQDLNACDLACIKLLSERAMTIMAVGDDDQSIYKFRKAIPAGIRNFTGDYRATSYPLTISHRCGKKILEWANFVIAGDTTRQAKPLLRPTKENSEGLVRYLVFGRENTEAKGVVRLVKWLHAKEMVSLEEILVLVRTNAIANGIKNEFRVAQIPFADPEEALAKFEEKNSRELICTLRLLSNRSDSLAWWSILYLTHGVGNKVISELYNLSLQNKCQFGEVLLEEAANDFHNVSIRRELLQMTINDIISKLNNITLPLSHGSWADWIAEQIKSGFLPNPTDGVLEILKKIDETKGNGEELTLNQYLNQIEPNTKDIMNSKSAGRVRIMTLNRSKGLTVRATIIAGVESELIPFPKGDYQEERRLLYVGMTRAREYLFLTRSRIRIDQTAHSGRENVASWRRGCPFLDGGPVREMPAERFLTQISG